MRQPPMANINRPMCPRLKKLNHISRLITMHNAKKIELGEPLSPRQLVDAILSARFISEFDSDSKSNDGRKARSNNATPRDVRNTFESSSKTVSPRLWNKDQDTNQKSPSSLVMSSGGVSSPSTSSISLISRAPSGDCKLRFNYQDDNWLSWTEDDRETIPSPDKKKNDAKSKRLANPIDKLQEIQQELLQAEEFLHFEDDSQLAARENERAYLDWLNKKNNLRKMELNGKKEKIKMSKAVDQILKEVANKKYTAPPVPSYEEWRRQKNEELRVAKLKEESKRKEEQALKEKRVALNKEAFAKWYRESHDKPKPLPVISATRLASVQSGPSLSWNPVPWDDEWSRIRDTSPVRTQSEPDASPSFCIRTMLDDCKSRPLSRRPSNIENRAVKSKPTSARNEDQSRTMVEASKSHPVVKRPSVVENRAVKSETKPTGARYEDQSHTIVNASKPRPVVKRPSAIENRMVKSETKTTGVRNGDQSRAVSETKIEKKVAVSSKRTPIMGRR